jgi:multicomponent K+:H+ antiporter subunit E
VLSAFLLALWLLLNAAVDPGTLLLGVAIALAAPVLSAPLRPTPVRMRRPLVALRLLATVVGDVIASNVAVAAGILSMRRRALMSAFVLIPLELRDANGLATLAMITTIVPGTVWCELAPDRSALLLHVFDVDDEERFVAEYKDRYERPLMEIFE